MIADVIKKELYNFLSAVDSVVSKQLERFRPLDEDGLTNVLLQCLDNDPDQNPHELRDARLRFDASLKSYNESESFEEPFYLLFEHQRFTKAFEGAVTQADLLLQLEYKDALDPDQSWSTAYLIQAKLPPTRFPDPQNIDEKIVYDQRQKHRISLLRKKIGETAFKYCFYCRPGILLSDDPSKVLARLNQRFGDVCDEISANQTAGIWITSDSSPTVRDIIQKTESESFCLARFIVAHYDERENNENIQSQITKYYNNNNEPNYDFLKKLCSRDESALNDIWLLMGGRKARSLDYNLRYIKIVIHAPSPSPKPHP